MVEFQPCVLRHACDHSTCEEGKGDQEPKANITHLEANMGVWETIFKNKIRGRFYLTMNIVIFSLYITVIKVHVHINICHIYFPEKLSCLRPWVCLFWSTQNSTNRPYINYLLNKFDSRTGSVAHKGMNYYKDYLCRHLKETEWEVKL